MNLQQLYYFQKLAQEHQYTKAAKALYISQPSLTKAIQSLETSLGTTLFERAGRKVELTESGKVFYRHVNAALLEIQKGQDKIAEMNGHYSASLKVATIPTIISKYVTAFLDDFEGHIDYNLQTHIFQGFSPNVLTGVKAGEFDIGFCNVPQNDNSVNKIKVGVQMLRLATPKRHKFANRSSISLEELKGEEILSYRTDNYIGNDIEKLVSSYHLNINYNYEDEVILCSTLLLKNKMALVLGVPSSIKNPKIKLIPIKEVPDNFHEIFMIYSKQADSKVIEDIVAFTKENYEKK